MGLHAARIGDGDRDPLPVWFRVLLGGLVAFVAALGLTSTAAALAGNMAPVPVAAISVVLAALACWQWLPALARRRGATGWAWLPAVLVIAVAVAFAVVNARSAGEHLLVDRDPGVYLTTAGSLAHDGSLIVDAHDAAFGHPSPSDVTYETQGFTEQDRGELVPQFLHLFPSLLGFTDGLFGLTAALILPALLGGLALLTVYAWATRVVPPWLALVAVTVLAVSFPQVYFARDAFSEETTQLFLFAGLWALAAADRAELRDQRVHALVAGVLFGLAAMTRIDADVVLALLAVWGIGVVALAPRGERLRRAPVWVAVGAAVPSVLGVVDAVVVSRGDYFHDVFRAPVLGAAVGGALAIGVVAFVVSRTRGWLHRKRATIALVAGFAVVVIGLAGWFVRPSVQTSRSPGRAAALVADEEAVQRAEGVTVDGTRTYTEDTVVWLAWYLGPVALGLGLAGLGLAVARSVGGRWPPSATAATVLVGGMTALYAWNPRVAPDQVWAMRRYVPITVPGLLVFGALAVHAAWAPVTRTIGRVPATIIVAVLVVAGAAVPVATTSAASATQELRGARRAVESTCDALPDRAVVLIPSRGPFAERFAPALRAFCHVDVAVGRADERQGDPELASRLADTARAAGRPFAVVSGVGDPFGSASPFDAAPRPVFSGTFRRLERTIESVPDAQEQERLDVFVLTP